VGGRERGGVGEGVVEGEERLRGGSGATISGAAEVGEGTRVVGREEERGKGRGEVGGREEVKREGVEGGWGGGGRGE